jgi:hypothetical protein
MQKHHQKYYCQKNPPSNCLDGGFCLAILVPMGSDLVCQWHDAMVFSLVFHDAGQCSLNVLIFNQKTHTAAQFSLNASGCRCNAVLYAMLQQQIPE